jgi:predicted transcriptional regulator
MKTLSPISTIPGPSGPVLRPVKKLTLRDFILSLLQNKDMSSETLASHLTFSGYVLGKNTLPTAITDLLHAGLIYRRRSNSVYLYVMAKPKLRKAKTGIEFSMQQLGVL